MKSILESGYHYVIQELPLNTINDDFTFKLMSRRMLHFDDAQGEKEFHESENPGKHHHVIFVKGLK